MNKPTSKISVSVISKLKDRLGQTTTPDVSEVSKQRAIGLLAEQLHAMHARGYTWRVIAELLSEEGLQVTPVALQGHLRRAKIDLERSRRKGGGRRVSEPAGVPRALGASNAAAAPAAPATTKTSTGGQAKGASPAASPPATTPAATRPEPVPGPGRFIPRRDSDEI